MSRIVIIIWIVFCLKLSVLGSCPNDTSSSRIECQNYQCPGATHSCNFDRDTRKYLCDLGCPINASNRDPCTCLAKYEGCHVQQNATDTIGRPMYENVPQTTYGCINTRDRNCRYEVHVVSAYRGNGGVESWSRVLSSANTTVSVSVNGTGNKSLILVLLSHYQMNWMLDIPSGVVFEKVLLSSYHLDISDVSYPPGSVLSVEKVANFLLPSLANGFDAHGNHTLQALEYLTERFGPAASFTGTGKADRWNLTLNRQSQDPECSQVATHSVTSQTPNSSPVISAQCHPQSVANRGSCYINAGATCSGDGYCRCPNMNYRDECTCLVKFGSCAIEKSTFGDNLAGVPAYRGHTQITSSCVANNNCHNSVHVISTYKTHLQHPGAAIRPGTVDVHISVRDEDDKPLILVLTSYYPINWRLNIPDSVVFDKIILSSYHKYLNQTSLSGAAVSSVEKLNCSETVQCYADGYNDNTVEQLKYLSDRFGPVSSWSSAYRTDSWNLNIVRKQDCSSFKTSTGNSNSACPVVPLTSTHTLAAQPSSKSAKSLNFGSNKESIIVGSIGVLVLLSIAVSVIIVSILKCRDQKISTSAGSMFSNSHGISYRQLLHRDSDFHEQTSTLEQEWTAQYGPETNGPHQRGLMNCPPPAYHTVVTLAQPVDECSSSRSSIGTTSNIEAPPPYPGS